MKTVHNKKSILLGKVVHYTMTWSDQEAHLDIWIGVLFTPKLVYLYINFYLITFTSVSDSRIVFLWKNLLFIKFRFSILSSRRKRLPVFVSVECEQADTESQRVQHFVLHRGQQDLQLLRLCRDWARTQVGVTSDWPKKLND